MWKFRQRWTEISSAYDTGTNWPYPFTPNWTQTGGFISIFSPSVKPDGSFTPRLSNPGQQNSAGIPAGAAFFYVYGLEVNLCSVEGTFKQFCHLFVVDGSRVGACAGIADSICGDRVKLFKELILLHAEFLNRLRNIHSAVEGFDLFDQRIHLCLFRSAAQPHTSCDIRISSHRFRFMGVVLDDIGKIDRVCASVGDMSRGERRTGLVRHRMHDSQKSV